ncbi:MAG: hypothetical protein ACXAAQ_13735 [Candidatus Thorarchaeota archaeon]|jgi:hypothetical protein
MMKNKGVMITLAVVVLLSSIPFTNAQLMFGVGVLFDSEPEFLGYQVYTSTMRVDGSLISGGFKDNPIFDFFNRTSSLSDYSVEWFWYHFAWSAFFEAYDTNKDGTFTPGVDLQVGAIVPLSNRWESWDYSDLLFEKQGEEGQLQVSQDSDFSELADELFGFSSLHINYTANMNITHQNDFLIRNVVGWSHVLGHTRPMDIEIEIRVHFNSTSQDHFKLELGISGWDWTYDDSILVFVFSPSVSIHPGVKSELYDVYNFTSIKHAGNRFSFGEGWIEYGQTASAGNVSHQVQVNASHAEIDTGDWVSQSDEDRPAIFTAFENFGNETLTHDLDIGVDSVELHVLPFTPTIPEIRYDELLLTASIISIIAIVIIFYRDTKNSFNGKALKPSV